MESQENQPQEQGGESQPVETGDVQGDVNVGTESPAEQTGEEQQEG